MVSAPMYKRSVCVGRSADGGRNTTPATTHRGQSKPLPGAPGRRPRRTAGAAGGQGGSVGGESDLAAVEPFSEVGGGAGGERQRAARVRVWFAVLGCHFQREVEERGGVLERVRVERVALRLVWAAVRVGEQPAHLRDVLPAQLQPLRRHKRRRRGVRRVGREVAARQQQSHHLLRLPHSASCSSSDASGHLVDDDARAARPPPRAFESGSASSVRAAGAAAAAAARRRRRPRARRAAAELVGPRRWREGGRDRQRRVDVQYATRASRGHEDVGVDLAVVDQPRIRASRP